VSDPSTWSLILTDACTDSIREFDVDDPRRQTKLALELVQRALVAADRRDGIGSVLLAGQIVADAQRAHAREDLMALREAIAELAEHVEIRAAPRNDQREIAEDVFGPAVPAPNGLAAAPLCVWPFSYVVAPADCAAGRTYTLADDETGLFDTHVHSELAYCASTVTVAGAVQRADAFGLAGVCLTEHAGQLYVSEDDFWSARFIHEPDLWRRAADTRMADYLDLTGPVRSDTVGVGFETEVDRDGALVLHDEHRQAADIVLGAIHWLTVDESAMTDAQFATAFLRQTEQLLAADVDVMAHPVRLFWRRKRELPDCVCRDLAAMLAATGTVAEINFHKNQPPEVFLRACLDAGVRFTFGSDSHAVYQVGNLGMNLAMLQRLSGRQDVSSLIWRP